MRHGITNLLKRVQAFSRVKPSGPLHRGEKQPQIHKMNTDEENDCSIRSHFPTLNIEIWFSLLYLRQSSSSAVELFRNRVRVAPDLPSVRPGEAVHRFESKNPLFPAPGHGQASSMIKSSLKMRLLSLWLLMGVAAMTAEPVAITRLREGDIVFTGSELGQGSAIMAATGSVFTHCGVVFLHEGKPMVIEAVHPVRVTGLREFIGGAKPPALSVKRLKQPLDAAKAAKAREWAAAQIGLPYDIRFQWGDDQLYCSELVWKIFARAGVELCKPRAVREYRLDHPKVRALIIERFGGMQNLAMEEKVVAPSDLAASPLLEDVPLGAIDR
jgi:hypothetical protein